MSLRQQLHAYIAELEQRLRWSTVLRGLAILTGSALSPLCCWSSSPTRSRFQTAA